MLIIDIFFSSRRRHTRCALVTGVQTCALPISAPQSIETNLLAHAVDAARARATLGEISSAMEEAFDRYATVPTPVKGVYAAPYRDDSRWAQVIDGVKAVERRLGRAPKLLIAKMGPIGRAHV